MVRQGLGDRSWGRPRNGITHTAGVGHWEICRRRRKVTTTIYRTFFVSEKEYSSATSTLCGPPTFTVESEGQM